MKRPRRISIGCYAVRTDGQEVIFRRQGRSGFKVEMSAGRKSPLFKRLRDAVAAAIEAANPWPFTVARKFDPILDLPDYLRRSRT